MIDWRSFVLGGVFSMLGLCGLFAGIVWWDLMAGAFKSSWTPVSNWMNRRKG